MVRLQWQNIWLNWRRQESLYGGGVFPAAVFCSNISLGLVIVMLCWAGVAMIISYSISTSHAGSQGFSTIWQSAIWFEMTSWLTLSRIPPTSRHKVLTPRVSRPDSDPQITALYMHLSYNIIIYIYIITYIILVLHLYIRINHDHIYNLSWLVFMYFLYIVIIHWSHV